VDWLQGGWNKMGRKDAMLEILKGVGRELSGISGELGAVPIRIWSLLTGGRSFFYHWEKGKGARVKMGRASCITSTLGCESLRACKGRKKAEARGQACAIC